MRRLFRWSLAAAARTYNVSAAGSWIASVGGWIIVSSSPGLGSSRKALTGSTIDLYRSVSLDEYVQIRNTDIFQLNGGVEGKHFWERRARSEVWRKNGSV